MQNLKSLLLVVFVVPLLMFSIGSIVVFPYFDSTFIQALYWILCISAELWLFIIYGALLFEPQEVQLKVHQDAPKYLNITVAVFYLLLGLFVVGKNSINLYNTSNTYKSQYVALEQSHKSLYDEMWKSYQQQNDVATINKDVFLETVRIQMDARKDGPSIAWKWANENTVIDHSVYSQFYADLSAFIANKRAELRELEEKKQLVAQQHNLLLSTFPNKIYSFVLGIEKIDYKYGFLSDKTNQTFALGIENLK